MVINIPLQIDDAALEGKLTEEYKNYVLDAVESRVDRALKAYDSGTYYGYVYGNNSFSSASAVKGLGCLIEQAVDKHMDEFIDANRDLIIEHASEKLANRLARSKKGKAILESFEEVK